MNNKKRTQIENIVSQLMDLQSEIEELRDKYMDVDTADLADSLDYYKTRYLNK